MNPGDPAAKAFGLADPHAFIQVGIVKTLTVEEAQAQLAELIAEAHQGAVIVLTDGGKQVWLATRKPLDLETDNPELEAELLKAIDGPFTPYSSQEMHSIGERIIMEKLDSRPFDFLPRKRQSARRSPPDAWRPKPSAPSARAAFLANSSCLQAPVLTPA